MFERFTERARRVVVLAQDEARQFGHDYMGTEHLLLGLLSEVDGVAAQALLAVGITPDNVREQVEGIVGYGEGTPAQAPFTPRSKKVFERALRESLQLGHNYIGTEHLLLGLLRESEGVAAVSLSNLNVDAERVRRGVLERIGGTTRPDRRREDPVSSERTREAPRWAPDENPWEGRPPFDKFTERAREVVALAQDEARHFNHGYVGTEHLLLGLVREEEGVAGQALKRCGVHLDEARGQVEQVVGYGEEVEHSRLHLTPRAGKVFRRAVWVAEQRGRDHVGTEHVLLGLVEEGEGVAARVLMDLGVGADAIRREVVRGAR